MVDHIVQEVLDEGQDRKFRTVGPEPTSRVLIGRERADPGNENLRSSFELVGSHLGVLLAVPFRDGCLILVPAGESRGVLAERLSKAGIEKAVDVANMGAVFQRRADVGLRAR